MFVGWDGQHNTRCILEEEIQRIYEVNLSSRVWLAGGFVAFRAVC